MAAFSLWRGWGDYGAAVVMFSFGGAELVGIAAAEADEPETAILKALRRFMARILLFYLCSMAVIMARAMNSIDKSGSPFVMIFAKMSIPAAADILNLVLITAAIFVVNSSAYLRPYAVWPGAAGQCAAYFRSPQPAQRALCRRTVFFSVHCIGLGLNYAAPAGAFMRILAIVTTALAICWAMIILSELHFRRYYEQARRQDASLRPLVFRSLFYTFSNYLCLAFLAGLFVLLLLTGFTADGLPVRFFGLSQPLITLPVPDISPSALIVPLWVCVLLLALNSRKGAQSSK